MAEDVKPVDPVAGLKAEAPEAPDAPEYTEAEQQAMQGGWKPKEEWEGNPDDWRPAKDWLDRGSLFKKINDLNRKLEQTNGALGALQTHHKMVYDTAHKQALADLKAERRVALREGDVERVEQIEEQMEAKQAEAVQAQRTTNVQVPQVSAEFEDFASRNDSWYGKDDVMTAYADRVGFAHAAALRQQGRMPTNELVLAEVEKKVREKFPNVFGTARKTAPNPVGPGTSPTRPSTSQKVGREAELPEEARSVMQSLVKSGVMTKDQYLKEYFGKGK